MFLNCGGNDGGDKQAETNPKVIACPCGETMRLTRLYISSVIVFDCAQVWRDPPRVLHWFFGWRHQRRVAMQGNRCKYLLPVHPSAVLWCSKTALLCSILKGRQMSWRKGSCLLSVLWNSTPNRPHSFIHLGPGKRCLETIPLPLGQTHTIFEGWPSVCCLLGCPDNGMAASAWDL